MQNEHLPDVALRDLADQLGLTMSALHQQARAAALGLVYVASGRFDGYIEPGVRLWDIAAGGLILECAGGEFWREPLAGDHKYRIIASNGRLRKSLHRQCPQLRNVFQSPFSAT